MENNNTMQEILETVTFIKDNAVSKEEFGEMNKRVTRMEALMVTKDYLDEKLADLRGDLVVLMRKEDTKLKTLVEVLTERNIITSADKKRILSLEPFPQLG